MLSLIEDDDDKPTIQRIALISDRKPTEDVVVEEISSDSDSSPEKHIDPQKEELRKRR